MRAESITFPSTLTVKPPVQQMPRTQVRVSSTAKVKPNLITRQAVNSSSPQPKHNFGKTYSDDGALMYIDAGIRGVCRYLENANFVATPYRIPFRAAAELVRHSTSGTLKEMLQDNKVTKKVFAPALRKTLENTLASAVFEPGQYQNRVAKMGIGFANMIVRVGARVMLTAMDFVDPGDLELENVADDFAGRSLLRGFWFDTKNPIAGILVPTIEQLGINKITHYLPIKNFLVPKIKDKVKPKMLLSS
ncbi:MAG: hypothetical protein HYZ79_03355 [Candidatus Melainabacteria bacterium]|nr:hypothetical protein [Candidatus Melainabacteria bacterium]